MTTPMMGRRYIDEAIGRMDLVRFALAKGLWGAVVREARECVERAEVLRSRPERGTGGSRSTATSGSKKDRASCLTKRVQNALSSSRSTWRASPHGCLPSRTDERGARRGRRVPAALTNQGA
jgi:hypothetical protein